MLEQAIKYKEELQQALKEMSINNPQEYSYVDPNSLLATLNINNSNKHSYVSVNKDEIVGYISYHINLQDRRVHNIQVINFTNNSIVFGFDLKRVLQYIFELYQFRKINFTVFVGHPSELTYDKMVEKYGGRIVGIQKEHSKLADGKYHDLKLYEILREDYLRVR